MKEQGVGARLRRKEDDRLMRGRGQFVADLAFAGMKDVAFVRSPLAHARLRRHDNSRRRTSELRLHPGRSRRRQTDSRGLQPARLQAVRPIAARLRQGAPCRRTGGDVRRADARAGRGHRRHCHYRSRRIAGRARHAGGARGDLCAGARAMGRQRFSRNLRRREYRSGARRADQGHARNPHRAAMHGADRRPRRRRLVGCAARAAHGLFGLPNAAYRAHRPCRVPRARRRPGAGDRARRRRRLRLQGHPARRRSLPRLARHRASAIRCAGSKTAASI